MKVWTLATLLSLSQLTDPSRADNAGEQPTAAVMELPTGAADMLERVAELDRAAGVGNRDGSIRVAGTGLDAGGKLELLNFLETARSRLKSLLGAPARSLDYETSVIVQPGAEDSPATIDWRVETGTRPELHLLLRDPAAAEAREVVYRYYEALLMADVVAAGWRPEMAESKSVLRREDGGAFPGWFAAGLARLPERIRRQDDAEAVLDRWSHAALPCLEVLVAQFSPYADTNPALAAQLLAWFLDYPERYQRYSSLKEQLSRGDSWDRALAEAVGGPGTGLADLDSDWDKWLLARRWTVLTPGQTHPALAGRLRSQLVMWPGASGVPFAGFPYREKLEPSDLIALRRESWMTVAASLKLAQMQRLGGGRTADFQEVTGAYALFFDNLHRRRSASRLQRSLKQAEKLLQEYERRQNDAEGSS